MKRVRTKIFAVILAAALLCGAVLPAAAAEGDGFYEVGKLSVASGSDGTAYLVNAVLYEQELIMATPGTIADLAGATLSGSGNSLELRRGNYAVRVDTQTGAVRIYLYFGSDYAQLYSGQNFILSNVMTAVIDNNETVVLPLEQMLYLLNVQWMCIEGTVYCYEPVETLWNVVGDYREMVANLPSSSEILGDTALEYAGNSFKYALLAFGDEVAPQYFVPYFGEKWWNERKVEEALLTLAAPCENLTGEVQANAEQDVAKYIGDLGGFVGASASVAGGSTSAFELMAKAFTSWSNVKVPDALSNAITGANIAAGVSNAISIAGRYQRWGESFKEQLEYLNEVQNSAYTDYCDSLNKVAASLVSEYGNDFGNAAWEAGKAVLTTIANNLFEKTPVGKAFSVYQAVNTLLDSTIPAVDAAQKAGDNASNAMRLCDLATLMRAEYSSVIAEVDGNPQSVEELEALRLRGSLMASAAAHSYDALYSVYLADDDTTSAELSALETKLIAANTAMTRFEETSQCDPSLLLSGDFANLYSTTAGAYREKVPPEYVIIQSLPVFSGSIAPYGDETYICMRAVPGLTSLELEPGSYDYICSMAFYRGRLYYSCKSTGTSEISSAIYSCELDGSDLTLLADHPFDYDTFSYPEGTVDCTSFLIWEGCLYHGYDGQRYVDLKTGESGVTPAEQAAGVKALLDAHDLRSITYVGDAIYYTDPYDYLSTGIYRIYRSDGENEEIIFEDPSLDRFEIEAVAGNTLYFSCSFPLPNYNAEYRLYALDLMTGTATQLDAHGAAGGGGYFNW